MRSEDRGKGSPIERGAAHGELPFSRYVRAGETIYVSGIVGRDPGSQELARDDLETQTRVALEVIEDILAETGVGLADVVKATIFVTDMARYGDVNRAYRRAFGDELPARTCVEVASLPDPEAQVEIEVVATRWGKR